MQKIPNIISVKDLLYIEDMLNWNIIMNKKIFNFLDCIEDSEILDLLNRIKKMHSKHYDELLNLLD